MEELYYFCKYVLVTARMEKEIPILCLASKIWDDESLENVHFPQVLKEISLKEVVELEKVFLRLIEFDLVVRGQEYAKFYFVLKKFSPEDMPMEPLKAEQI